MIPTPDLIQLAGLGATLVIDGRTKTTSDLIQIAGVVKSKNGQLVLRNANAKSTSELIQLTGICPKNITLDFVVI